jgi:salicylate hydroxylase
MDLDLVERWQHPSGKVTLLGDACHPMLPYMASGAAMATEDAAVLRAVLKEASRETVPDMLKRYQAIRQPRASVVCKAGRNLQHTYHLPDGEEQQARDKLMIQEVEENPVFWGFEDRRKWLFGHDAEEYDSELGVPFHDLSLKHADDSI